MCRMLASLCKGCCERLKLGEKEHQKTATCLDLTSKNSSFSRGVCTRSSWPGIESLAQSLPFTFTLKLCKEGLSKKLATAKKQREHIAAETHRCGSNETSETYYKT